MYCGVGAAHAASLRSLSGSAREGVCAACRLSSGWGRVRASVCAPGIGMAHSYPRAAASNSTALRPRRKAPRSPVWATHARMRVGMCGPVSADPLCGWARGREHGARKVVVVVVRCRHTARS